MWLLIFSTNEWERPFPHPSLHICVSETRQNLFEKFNFSWSRYESQFFYFAKYEINTKLNFNSRKFAKFRNNNFAEFLKINVAKFRWQIFGEVFRFKNCTILGIFQVHFQIISVVSFDSERGLDPVHQVDLFCWGFSLANY
jgi:hypothetical protein